MIRISLTAAMLVAVVVLPVVCESADQVFSDSVCEKATPIGRRLNDLVAKNDTLTPELVAAAVELRDTYESCVSGYDRDATSGGGHGGEQYATTNAALIGRLYARLALARALIRVAEYKSYEKRFDDAGAASVEARRRLDEMESIQPLNSAHAGTPERTLLARAQDVRITLAATAAKIAERQTSAASVLNSASSARVVSPPTPTPTSTQSM